MTRLTCKSRLRRPFALQYWLWLWLCLAPSARAEDVEDSLPLTDDPTDPIGIDREPEPEPPPNAAHSGRLHAGTKPPRDDAGPEPPPFAAQAGEVLTAPASVRESSHHEKIELSRGLARVSLELEFENAGEKPAELVYRLAVPADAAVYALEVCNTHGCRTGLPDPGHTRLNAYDDVIQARPNSSSAATSELPAGDARIDTDARGTALWLRAAKVTRAERLRVHAAYLTQAPLHGGVTRLQLPARGMDARAAPTSVQLTAPDHTDLQINHLPVGADASVELDAWSPIELSTRSTSRGVHADYWSAPCGKHQCLHAYAAASADKPAPTEIYLAIDASPSTEGAARSRLLVAVTALLSRAPEGSRVRALRFASDATPLMAERKNPRELQLSVFAPITYEAELGAATRFESAWQTIEQSGFTRTRGPKLVVIVGDGGLTTGQANPFEAAKRKGVAVAVVNVADRRTTAALARGAALTGGAVVDAGLEADAAARGASPEPLEDRVAAVFQPSRGVLRTPDKNTRGFDLRAGDSVMWEAAMPRAPALKLGARTLPRSAPPRSLTSALRAYVARTHTEAAAPTLVAVERADLQTHLQARLRDRPSGQDQPKRRGTVCDRRGPARRLGGLSPDDAPVQLAQERALCAVPAAASSEPSDDEPELGIGMPGSPLLGMLRQRIMPVARGCFRRDRAGRPDYQVRAVFVFELAEREVISAAVQGKIAQALRDCLLTAVDSLAVPRFTGRVVVRYPLVTEREPLPSQIELTPETAGEIDRLIGP